MEQQNRAVHRANVGLDRVIARPVSQAYGAVLPLPVRTGVSNFADNLGTPGLVLNNLMQARIEAATSNAFRFILNTTFGLGGMLDFASAAGIPKDPTDFGETLYVWGVPEGTYTELPVLGPSTSRHVVGRVVDFAINPLNAVTATPESGIITGTRVGARIGDRYRYSDLVDSVLYESADSYAQAKLLYLQNRRFALSGAAQVQEFDPYEDVYGQE
jgi:phospholipid-binding lipoprotein MlaA